MVNDHSKYVDLLAIFHFVVAGLAALFSLIPVLHLVIGIGLATGAFERQARGEPAAIAIGVFFALMAMLAIALGLTYSVLMVLAGRALQQRRRHTFCLVMAGISCAFVPFGTVLGVLTIIVLVGDPVREAFGLAD